MSDNEYEIGFEQQNIIDSIYKSQESKSKKKNNFNNSRIYNLISDKKKMRRSRIIIHDTSLDSPDHKRETYDMETKLKKSVYSALAFNHNLNSNRRENSKHFLKRKIKAAYEREPIEKNKSFFKTI